MEWGGVDGDRGEGGEGGGFCGGGGGGVGLLVVGIVEVAGRVLVFGVGILGLENEFVIDDGFSGIDDDCFS